jgi:uncharacterized membrane protein YhfC
MASLEAVLPVILIGIGLAIGPALAVAVYVARSHRALWVAFLWGWAGWLIALVLRLIPVQIPQVLFLHQIQTDVTAALLFGFYASALAGLFEEGIRYFFLRRPALRASGKTILSFGLGWGLGEAIILFVPALALLPLVPGPAPSTLAILPGALERNLAIIAHVALTFIVLHAVAGRRGLLVLAIGLHFALNAAALSILILTADVWLTELAIAAVVVVTLAIATWVSRGWAVPPVEATEPPPLEAEPPGS